MSNFEGQRIVVCGCYSGIGYEVARSLLDQGAEVIGLDVKPTALAVSEFIRIDLGSALSIAAAVDQITGTIDALVVTSAIFHKVNSGMDCQTVNFLGIRQLTEALIPKIARGGSIALTSSAGGAAYQSHMTAILDLLNNHQSFEEGQAWSQARPKLIGPGYYFSKECINVYVMWRAFPLFRQTGIRLNCVAPGAVDSEAMNAWAVSTGDPLQSTIGKNPKPVDQVAPLLFLISESAKVINGQVLWTEQGMLNAQATGQLDLSQGYPE